MDSRTMLSLTVLLTEVLLTVSLVGWMRSAVRGTQVPWKSIFHTMFWGAMTALIASVITWRYSFDLEALQETAPDIVNRWYTTMVITNIVSGSVIEELAKYAIGVFLFMIHKHHHRLSDTIITMIVIGLGFSLIEDLLYLLDPTTLAPYRLLSFYVHSGTSAIIGYSLGRFRFGLAGYRELARALISAILLHTLFNLSTQVYGARLALGLTVFVTLFISLQIFILFRKTLEEEYQLDQRVKPKPRPTKLLNL